MSGIPQFNFPAFDRAAEGLRRRGFTVISPAELDDRKTREDALASPDGRLIDGKSSGQTWGEFLARDVKIVSDQVQGIILMPGWETSRGAKLEAYVGLLCKHDFKEIKKDGALHSISPHHVMALIEAGTSTSYQDEQL